MADSIADLLTGSVLQSGQKTGDLAGSIAQGAGLAQQIEQTQLLRQQIEKQKQDMEFQKISKIGEWYDHATKMPEGAARKAFMQNFIPAGIQALGMEKKIDPTVVKMIEAEPSVVGYLKDKLERRELNMSDLQQALVDPSMMAQLMEKTALGQFGGEQALKGALTDYQQTLAKAGTTGVAEAGKFGRAELMGQQSMAKQQQAQQATGQVKELGDIGKAAAQWKTGGGAAAAESTIRAFDEVINDLESGNIKTGTKEAAGLKAFPEATKFLSEDAKKLSVAVNKIRGAVNLRSQLADASPTEWQVKDVMNRNMDVSLSPKELIADLRRQRDKAIKEFIDKQKTMVQKGLLAPEEVWSPKASGATPKQKSLYKAANPDIKTQMINALSQSLKIDPAKARKMLEE